MPNPLRRLFAKDRPDADGRPEWVVVGLGNPGERYARTRHNAGFWCLDLLAERAGVRFNDKRQHAEIGRGRIAGIPVVLSKPRTFMNNSGVAAKYLCTRFGVKPERLLVVVDDMDLPPGKLRLRASGGTGGHNGLKSINAELGTDAYPRLRIGVGRPAGDAIGHVLGSLSPHEQELLQEALPRAAEIVEACIEHGVEYAMNRYN